MTDRQDIASRADIDTLLVDFYGAARLEALLGPVFESAITPDAWPGHLKRIGDFWETVLLHTARYSGGPIPAHIALDKQSLLTLAHFDRWLELFNAALDNLFTGPVAAEAKRRAALMAPLMLYKVEAARGKGFVQ